MLHHEEWLSSVVHTLLLVYAPGILSRKESTKFTFNHNVCLVNILKTAVSLKDLRMPTSNHIQSYSKIVNDNDQEVFYIPVGLW